MICCCPCWVWAFQNKSFKLNQHWASYRNTSMLYAIFHVVFIIVVSLTVRMPCFSTIILTYLTYKVARYNILNGFFCCYSYCFGFSYANVGNKLICFLSQYSRAKKLISAENIASANYFLTHYRKLIRFEPKHSTKGLVFCG